MFITMKTLKKHVAAALIQAEAKVKAGEKQVLGRGLKATHMAMGELETLRAFDNALNKKNLAKLSTLSGITPEEGI